MAVFLKARMLGEASGARQANRAENRLGRSDVELPAGRSRTNSMCLVLRRS